MEPSPENVRASARYEHIDGELEGQRLDNFLLGLLKGVPRAHVYRLIRSGQVRVNSGRAAPSYRLKAGDRVRVPPVATRARAAAGVRGPQLEWLAERIVFEDARLLVLDKPAGFPVHGGSGVSLGCIEALRVLRPKPKTLELVHRLDRDTSGCLLVAKRRSALRSLHAVLRAGTMEKRYLALLEGRWEKGEVELDLSLARVRRGGETLVRVDAQGKRARSRFRLLQQFGGTASLVEITILTGRTHQIRVHAAHLGHPVAGDLRYGDSGFNGGMQKWGLNRMFLHAHFAAFAWPDGGEEFSVSVPLPKELAAVLDRLSAA